MSVRNEPSQLQSAEHKRDSPTVCSFSPCGRGGELTVVQMVVVRLVVVAQYTCPQTTPRASAERRLKANLQTREGGRGWGRGALPR